MSNDTTREMSGREMSGEPVLFTGGPIRQLGPSLGAEPPEALLVQDGRVRAAGTVADVRRVAGRTPRGVDLDGRT